MAGRLGLGLFQNQQDRLDGVQGFQDQRDRVGADVQLAIAEAAQHVLRRMGHRFQPRQAEEAARALDGVNQPEDVAQQAGVIRVLLKPHQLNVQDRDVFIGLGQKFAQQIIHGPRPVAMRVSKPSRRAAPFGIRFKPPTPPHIKTPGQTPSAVMGVLIVTGGATPYTHLFQKDD
ncbi:hypothetical protein AZA_87600 [Nitrospirillum viridazoti Y2]|nr:hypothetical protein AZA_87600 [Nitrospirillum amazonense Y2]